MDKKKLPKVGEIITATITTIQPNSAFAKLEGYDREGMIHISEIASGWVKDIRKHVKKGQKIAVKVIRVDPVKGYINLSIKAVGETQKTAAFRDKHLQKKADKMLEIAAESQGKTLKQAYEEVGHKLEDAFGSLHRAFELSVKKPEKLEKAGFPESWIKAIKNVAEKNITQKHFTFKADIEMQTFEEQGIEKIKNILKSIEKKKVKVSYISAPKYTAQFTAKDAKKATKAFTKILEDAEKHAKEKNVQFSFKMQE